MLPYVKSAKFTLSYFSVNLIIFQLICCHQLDAAQCVVQPTVLTTQVNHLPNTTKSRFAIVLLHGLGMDRKEMCFLAEKLVEQYKEKVLIINSKKRKGKTFSYSVAQQAEIVYREITAELVRYHKDCQSFPLFIIGQSQGGVVATLMAKRYKHKLNMLGFVTHNAPLQGVELLTRRPCDIRKFQKSTAKYLPIIGAAPDRLLMVKVVAMRYGRYLFRLFDYVGYPMLTGLRDLLPYSPCMLSIYRYLRNAHPKGSSVPGLLIAGYQNDYSNLFSHAIARHKAKYPQKMDNKINQAIQLLNHATATLLTGDKNGLHDHLLSLKSQLCREDNLAELTKISHEPYYINMPDNPDVICYVVKHITHCQALSPILAASIEPDESMLTPRRMLPVLFQFIEEELRKLDNYLVD